MYPALAVLDSLQTLTTTKVQTLWVGGEGGMEAELIQRQNIPYTAIPAAGIHGVGIRTLPKNLKKLAKGVLQSRNILRGFKPDLLFFTGGYVAVPMAIAGWRIPSLLFVPDIEPGLALKSLARFAAKITVSTPNSAAYFSRPERIVVTGYPTRPDLTAWNRKTARQTIGLNTQKPVLLVFGGSKGARSINNAVLENLVPLLEKTQVLHISGKADWEKVQKARNALKRDQAQNYLVFDYLHEEMGAALAAADLVISRAGASSLGEFPLFGLPALLVPYPYAWRYQKVNAEFLEKEGAAEMIKDEKLTEQLLPRVESLLGNTQKLNAMRQAMKNLARPQAAKRIATEMLALAGKR